ncbi:aspartate--tRNA(Asn) ligase [Candidatus Daviesbacteria bacterium]|nr:aspartate--tRNA(Asn) ligase [Candidatus Daviesbacteria bacterium]
MERTLILDCNNKIGEKVKICGWVWTRRDHGKILFLDVTDRSGLIQVVVEAAKAPDLHPQDVVCIEGKVNKRPENLVNKNIPTGEIEISAESVEVLSKAKELPFDMGRPTLNLELPTLLDWRSLTLRHASVKAIFKIEEVVIDAFRRALQAKDFVEFQAPAIIPSIPEGGSEVFAVKYFNHQVYLSQSPQLYKSLLVGVFERVFSVNKVFRAEPSVTSTHITEFVSLDAEFGFIDSWEEVRDMADYVIKFILREVGEKCAKELAMFNATVPAVSEKIPTIKMREAQQIIFERTGRDCRQEKDLSPEDEREICKWAKENQSSDLIFVSHYPTKYRPFYTYPDEENPEFNQGFDLLGRGREWLTGGRRINDYEVLMEHVRQWGVDPEEIKLYLQAFEYGVPPLGGFAFGAERVTMFILGLSNIREASLFPRDMERVDIRLNKE